MSNNLDSSLLAAVVEGNPEEVIQLIAAGANVNMRDHENNTLLYLAMGDGIANREAVVNALLAGGAEVDARVAFSTTALMRATEEGYVNIAQALIAAGADVNASDRWGDTPLIIVSPYNTDNHRAIARMLITENANLFHVPWEDGQTALMIAAMEGNLEMVRTLLEDQTPEQKQLLFAQVDHNFTNAVTLAFENGHQAVVDELIRQRAILPEHLQRQDLAGVVLNNVQSTHEVSVHESVSCSILGLASHYLPGLSDEARVQLIVQCGENKNKAHEVLNHALMQDEVQDYIDTRLGFLLCFGVNLQTEDCQFDEHNELKVQSAKRCIARILGNQNILEFRDGRSQVPMKLALALVWDGLWDPTNTHLMNFSWHEKAQVLVQSFYDMQRGYNLNTDGNETDIKSEDISICVPGHFNKLVSSLAGGRHEMVNIIFVTTQIVRLRTQSLIGLQYLKEVPFDEIIKSFREIENTGILPCHIWRKYLKESIENKVKEEYQSFVEAGMISEDAIQEGINDACQLPLSAEIIAKMLLKSRRLVEEIGYEERSRILSKYGLDETSAIEPQSEYQVATKRLNLDSMVTVNRGLLNLFRLKKVGVPNRSIIERVRNDWDKLIQEAEQAVGSLKRRKIAEAR